MQQQADNYNISRFLFNSFPYPYTIDEAGRWVTSHQNQDPITNFAIVIDEKVAGGIEFKRDKDVHAKNATLGYWLGETYWGRGVMTEATNLITAYAFKDFDIIRIQATVNDNNPASMRVLEKAGFKKEGIMRNAIVKHGEVMDEHLYALLK